MSRFGSNETRAPLNFLLASSAKKFVFTIILSQSTSSMLLLACAWGQPIGVGAMALIRLRAVGEALAVQYLRVLPADGVELACWFVATADGIEDESGAEEGQ